ncbi:hypothetical protein MROS_0663 [Melioribacter roseus P3M-2]|uniref:Uncharacterized protein n=1 Tax=Melioribacter roseus (strain DSM 23840 / JCM 17771 / VKM B-2668 / P3M-2) TaxID=1191523 RepID=I7A1X4_MELRP|nr:DUF1684 domain-containing protein [Melioribacter roseus]AFN73906.1 hypothetical protein MROS_0663 [Melioribacter roseus P3M-2]
MKRYFLILFSFMLFNCTDSLKEKGAPEYIDRIKEWRNKRIENLKKENGWLNLAGLYWLKEGKNSFGSDPSNDIVFPPEAPGFIGYFVLSDSTVTVKINDNIEVYENGIPVKEKLMRSDMDDSATVLQSGRFKWFVIKRGNLYGIRLRDLESPLLRDFEGIETYPVNSDWRIEARFEPYNPPKKINIPTIIGTTEEEVSPGALVFEKEGNAYRLDAIDAGNRLFIVFADKTSGIETYGAGRFLYADKPDSTGTVIIDFNMAYNPPCAFTRYATCPLPPKQNYLNLRITAGEKNYGELHH